MANLPDDVATRVRGFASLISDDDLYDDGSGEHGRETDPHITVKYGLHTDDGNYVSGKLVGQKAAQATLGRMSVFENEKFTVLKVDIDSIDLHELNKFVSDNFDVTDSFPVYHPHATIAYLKKGVDWRKYACDLFQGTPVTFDELLYSTATDVETIIDLDPTAKVARLAGKVANKWLERYNVADQFPDHKTEMQVKIQLAYDGEDEHQAQQDFMDKLAGLGARKVQIIMGAADPDGIGVN